MRKKKRLARKKIRKRQKRNRLLLRYKRHQREVYIFGIISLIITFFVLIIVIFKKTIFSDKYTIAHITYTEESLTKYDNPELYKEVSQAFLGRNYYRTQWFTLHTLEKKLQATFPIIDAIHISFSSAQSIEADLSFHTPSLVFRTPSQRVAVYKKSLYPLTEKDSLGSESIQIDLPRYTSGFDSLDGVLYQISAKKIKTIANSIYNTLGEKNITEFTYLPGGKLIFLRYKGKQVYFNIKQNIDAQLIKLIDLENRYPKFSTLSKIDVGSTDDVIVK